MASIETVVSRCERVVFNKGNFYIFYTEDGFSVKGNSNEDITPGIKYEMDGKWSEYNGTPQLTATRIEAVKDNEFKLTLISDFLVNYIKGVGEKTAMKLAETYGESVLDVLLRGDEEEIKKSKALTRKKMNEIKDFIEEYEELLYEQFQYRMLGIPFGAIDKITEIYEIKFDQVTKNPFILMRVEGIGFDLCESIFEKFELDVYSIDRFMGAIETTLLKLHLDTGNSYFDYQELNNEVFKLLFDRHECKSEEYLKSFFAAVDRLIDIKKVVVYTFVNNKVMPVKINVEGARVALSRFTKTEIDIKRQVYGFINARKIDFDLNRAEQKIDVLSSLNNIELDPKQREALLMCMNEPLSIITGGPGTGKTTIMGLLAQHFKKENIKCVFCAPTGRAAKRLSESIDDKAYTIHRLLGINRSDEDSQVEYCSKNHLDPIDARVVVVDEMSMVDMEIFILLLDAIASGSSLILVGDPNQLPSVGPGNILKDLLSYDKVPKIELSYIFRQSGESLIATNAYRILAKEQLKSDDKEFIVKDFDDEEQAQCYIRDLYMEVYTKSEDAVILSPTKQNFLGTMRLNEYLQSNVITDDEGFRVRSNLTLHKGDRVMQIKNDYQIEYEQSDSPDGLGKGVYNGELGEVVEADEDEEYVLIRFDDGKIVPYTKPQLENIELSYAMTVHKAQGCEFDVVILVLGRINYMLSNWKILYTAITRAKKKLVIVNFGDRVNKMIMSDKDYGRKTSLLDFLNTGKASGGDKA